MLNLYSNSNWSTHEKDRGECEGLPESFASITTACHVTCPAVHILTPSPSPSKSAGFYLLSFSNYRGKNHTHRLPGKGTYYSNPTMEGGKHLPEVKIFGQKLPYDLPLVERVLPAKFHCIWSHHV
jgi:hypothetical protein